MGGHQGNEEGVQDPPRTAQQSGGAVVPEDRTAVRSHCHLSGAEQSADATRCTKISTCVRPRLSARPTASSASISPLVIHSRRICCCCVSDYHPASVVYPI